MTAMRVAVYLRQSNVRDGNQLAVSRQRDECVKLCEAKGWTTTCTSTTTSRPPTAGQAD
jgi:hypothetical protein